MANDNPDELDLVVKAITSHVSGDCEWQERAARRVRGDSDLKGLTPEGIKALLQVYVAGHPDQVRQVRDNRPEYAHQNFFYKVIVPVDEFKHGLFIEIILIDADPKDPAVQIVSTHEQKR
jgi:hypothetical protein